MKQKYAIDSEKNKKYLSDMADELLRFGVKFPSENGGSYYLGGDGNPMKERNIETWITCRMIHVYSMGAMMGFDGAKELVMKGLKGLMGWLMDQKNGGWYQGITADNRPLGPKQAYAHAFVLLATSSALLAGISEAKALLGQALDVYDKYFWDEDEGLSKDTWNTEFTVCDSYRGINANMHAVEAFLAVADVTGDEQYRLRAGRIIDRVIAWAEVTDYRIPEHFTDLWEPDYEMNKEKPDDPFKPYGATPGHGIEWARLIVQYAVSMYGEKTDPADMYIHHAERLFNRAMADGWCADGSKGIAYTTDWAGNLVVRDRMHWTLAEAINTSAVLFHITGKQSYASVYADLLEYLDENVHDKINGSWFHQLDENNRLKETVWPGKSDIYHAYQSMLIPYMPIGVSIAKAVCEAKKENNVDWIDETLEKINEKMLKVAQRNKDKIPYTTDENGQYDDRSDSLRKWPIDDGINWWTNGFWGGLMWLMYQQTQSDVYADVARTCEQKLDKAFEGFLGLHHDVGFMFVPTAVADYKLTGNEDSKKIALHAANILAGRFNPVGKYIRAWNDLSEDTRGWAIIDCMFNISILYWAYEETKDPRFLHIASMHADTVQKYFVRDDGSVCHIVEFDPFDGHFVRSLAGQGYKEGSSWSRGQGWALYGFTISYLHTKKAEYLKTAKKVADYCIANLDESGIVPVDFRQPQEPAYEDSCGACVIAGGLLELAKCLPASESRAYVDAAIKILRKISEDRADYSPETDAIVKGCTPAYRSEKKHITMNYADFYFIEALQKLKGIGMLIW